MKKYESERQRGEGGKRETEMERERGKERD